jgi:hypothetical protein
MRIRRICVQADCDVPPSHSRLWIGTTESRDEADKGDRRLQDLSFLDEQLGGSLRESATTKRVSWTHISVDEQ